MPRLFYLLFKNGAVFSEVIDLDSLAGRVYRSIIQREFLETRHNTMEDDGLIGLLNLMSNILKHDPSFKTGKEGHHLLNEVFNFHTTRRII